MALVKVYPKRKCYDPIGNDNKRFTTFFCTFTSCKHIQDYSNTYTSHRRVHFNRNFCGIFCFTCHKRERATTTKKTGMKPQNRIINFHSMFDEIQLLFGCQILFELIIHSDICHPTYGFAVT